MSRLMRKGRKQVLYNQRFVAVFHVYALLKTVRSAKQLAEFWTKVNSSNVKIQVWIMAKFNKIESPGQEFMHNHKVP